MITVTIFCKDGSMQVVRPPKAEPDLLTRDYAIALVGPENFWKMEVKKA